MPETIKKTIFKPHKFQAITWDLLQSHTVTAAVTSIRAGKSEIGTQAAVRTMIEKPGCRGLFIAPTWPAVYELLNNKILKMLDTTGIPYLPDISPGRPRKQIRFPDKNGDYKNGSVLLLQSAEKFEEVRYMDNLDFIWADESEQYRPGCLDVFKGRVMGVGGWVLLTTSPQKRIGYGAQKRLSWIYTYLVERGIEMTLERNVYTEKTLPGIAPDTVAIRWSIEDNPYYPKEQAVKLRREYGPLKAAQELDGLYVDLEGEVIFTEDCIVAADVPGWYDYKILVVDPAVKEHDLADYTVIYEIGVRGKYVYVISETRGHYDPVRQLEIIAGLYKEKGVSEVVIEDVAYQYSVINHLKSAGVNATGVKPRGDKVARAVVLAAQLKTGRIIINREIAENLDFRNEILGFPTLRYDDRVDALGYGVNHVFEYETSGVICVSGDYKQENRAVY